MEVKKQKKRKMETKGKKIRQEASIKQQEERGETMKEPVKQPMNSDEASREQEPG
jgi:ABC-type hemin transport system substrate-binding protein